MVSSLSYIECKYCGKKFKLETRFEKHECKEMKRDKESRSMIGIFALALYKRWIKRKGGNANRETFVNSHYYRTFINIATFLKEVDIIDPNIFVDFMCDRKYMPTIWIQDTAYSDFLIYLDRRLPARKLVNISIKTIIEEAETLEVDESKLFEVISPQRVISLLQTRRLSPWVLFPCIKFRIFYETRLSKEQKAFFTTFLDSKVWSNRYNEKRNKKVVEDVKTYLNELGL